MKNGFDPKIGDSLPGRPDTQGLEILRLECGWLVAFVAGDTIINNTFAFVLWISHLLICM